MARALEATDVAKAVARLERHRAAFVLMFTDIQMPGDRNGFDRAQEVAERWPSPEQLPERAVFIRKLFLSDGEKPGTLKRKEA